MDATSHGAAVIILLFFGKFPFNLVDYDSPLVQRHFHPASGEQVVGCHLYLDHVFHFALAMVRHAGNLARARGTFAVDVQSPVEIDVARALGQAVMSFDHLTVYPAAVRLNLHGDFLR